MVVPDEVRTWLAERGYDPRYGARPLNRLLSREVGNGLAEAIIKGELRTGNEAVVGLREGGDGLVVGNAAGT